ncbi:hypothetical protein VNO77_17203 [Canavalia gladiata]|uniref:Uncharacterized protein n=1 Tax=Canavalia gladiata TaxID=3824 RepID=A0AAN9LIJ3_CANGL
MIIIFQHLCKCFLLLYCLIFMKYSPFTNFGKRVHNPTLHSPTIVGASVLFVLYLSAEDRRPISWGMVNGNSGCLFLLSIMQGQGSNAFSYTVSDSVRNEM